MQHVCSKVHSAEKHKLQEMFSLRRMSPVFYVVFYFCGGRASDLIDGFQQCLDVEMCINPLCQRHSAGMADDLLDHGLIHMGLRHHGDAGVSGIVRQVFKTKTVHHGSPVAVIVVPVFKAFTCRCMEEVFAVGAFIPCPVE